MSGFTNDKKEKDMGQVISLDEFRTQDSRQIMSQNQIVRAARDCAINGGPSLRELSGVIELPVTRKFPLQQTTRIAKDGERHNRIAGLDRLIDEFC